MTKIEQLELKGHRSEIIADVKRLNVARPEDIRLRCDPSRRICT